MKKSIKVTIIALCSVIVCAIVALSGCTTYTTYMPDSQVIVKSSSNIYAASWYKWDGQEQTKTFTIPDSYNGHPITHIGFTPMPYYYCFGISFPAEYNGCEYLSYNSYTDSGYEYEVTAAESVLFTVYIGGNVFSLYSISYDGQFYLTQENTAIYLYPEFYFECSADNKYFYSRDGVLYNKDGTKAEWKYIEDSYYKEVLK